MIAKPPSGDDDARLAQAVEKYRERKESAARALAARVMLVGSLGWLVVLPTLLGTWAGHCLDRRFQSGVFWTAAGLMVGVGLGSWLLWKSLPGPGGST
jgi:ATP synthase protein I